MRQLGPSRSINIHIPRLLFSSPLSSRIVRWWLHPITYACLGYSPLDSTTLDPHWGRRDEWRSMIDAVHARGMYYVADFMVTTMSDLIAWEG